MGLDVTYKGQQIAQLTEDGNLTLETAGKYCEGDIELAYSGGGGGSIDWDDFISGDIPEGALVLDTSTNVPNSLFYGNHAITSVSGPLVTTIGADAFHACSMIEQVSFPALTTVGAGAFYNCYRLRGESFPELTTTANDSFRSAGSLTENDSIWVLPKVTSIATDCFRQAKVTKVDLGPDCASLGTRAFYHPGYGGYISDLILRKTDGVVSCGATNSIDKINSNTKVYVPSSLISTYEQASIWSTKGSIFYAIEGSQYENYYADGTPISNS